MASMVYCCSVWAAVIYTVCMQSPKIFLVVTAGLVIMLGSLSVYFLHTARQPIREEYVTLPSAGTSTVPNTGAVSEQGFIDVFPESASSIYIRDPRTFTRTTDLGDDQYLLTPLEAAEVGTYSIVFDAQNNSIAVGLVAEPIAQARRDAEQYLITALGLQDPLVLCAMSVYVGTTQLVNEFYAGQNLGVSFCPDSVQLD